MSDGELFIAIGFATGFVGSIHCVGMCGGLVGVISGSLKTSFNRTLVFWCGYHFGRIVSYAIAGFLVAGTVQQLVVVFPLERAHAAGTIIAGVFLVILGGHIAQWWRILNLIEKVGGRAWKKIVPIYSKLLPPKVLSHCVIGGLLWGWIPCGLVYSALGFAATASSATLGGITMLSFGVGTLPMLFAMGVISHQSTRLREYLWIRKVVGGVFCVLGLLITMGIVPIHVGHPSI